MKTTKKSNFRLSEGNNRKKRRNIPYCANGAQNVKGASSANITTLTMKRSSLQNTVKIWNVPIRVRAALDLPNVFTLIRIKTVFAATVTVGDT